MLTLTRFTVASDVIAAGLTRLGITPIASSALAALPAATAPQKVLKKAELETSDGVVPEFAAALEVLAAPSTILSVTSNRAGRSTFRTANFVRSSVTSPVVMQARTRDGGMDLAVVPTVTEATVLIDQLLNVTAFPGGGDGSWTMSLPGYAALLAMCDMSLEAETTARLERRLASGPPSLSAAALEDQLTRGTAGNDTRWAVTAGQVTMLRGLLPARGHMAGGLEELVTAGLAVRKGNEVRPSGHGDTLAAMFAQLFSCGSVTLSHVVDGKQVVVGFLSLFRSVAGLLTANIAADEAEMPTVEVVRATQAGVILTLRRMLENQAPGPELVHVPSASAPASVPAPAPSPPPAPSAPAPTPPAPAAPPPAPAAPAWAPTHVVPAAGLPAWVTPDPNVEPTATLDPGLPVRLDRVDTGWAHLTCSNGWECWVNASLLEDLPGGGR